MKLSRIERLTWVGCPWLFGAVYIVVGLILPAGGEPVVKTLMIGLGLLFMCLYCIASLLAKLVEKDTAKEEPTSPESSKGD